MTTRSCSRCGQAKTIQGVWYLLSNSLSGAFVCETCYRRPAETPSPLGRAAPQLGGLGLLPDWSTPSVARPASAGSPRFVR
jgi:hypothetical protein